jgi:hypothetical protein
VVGVVVGVVAAAVPDDVLAVLAVLAVVPEGAPALAVEVVGGGGGAGAGVTFGAGRGTDNET